MAEWFLFIASIISDSRTSVVNLANLVLSPFLSKVYADPRSRPRPSHGRRLSAHVPAAMAAKRCTDMDARRFDLLTRGVAGSARGAPSSARSPSSSAAPFPRRRAPAWSWPTRRTTGRRSATAADGSDGTARTRVPARTTSPTATPPRTAPGPPGDRPPARPARPAFDPRPHRHRRAAVPGLHRRRHLRRPQHLARVQPDRRGRRREQRR